MISLEQWTAEGRIQSVHLEDWYFKLVSDFCRDIQLCTLCVFVEISFRRHYSICQYSQTKCTPRISLHLDIGLICHIFTIGLKCP